jgi:hypothetical protein
MPSSTRVLALRIRRSISSWRLRKTLLTFGTTMADDLRFVATDVTSVVIAG